MVSVFQEHLSNRWQLPRTSVISIAKSSKILKQSCKQSWHLSHLSPTWSKYVSFELRKGTCLSLLPMATITSPNALRLLLMFCASFMAWPCAPLSLTRSLPARSIRFSTPLTCCPVEIVCVCVGGEGGVSVCVCVSECVYNVHQGQQRTCDLCGCTPQAR